MNKREKAIGLRGVAKDLLSLHQKTKTIQDKLTLLKSEVNTQAIEAAIARARSNVQEEARKTGF
jgi:hypothetical protein